MQFILYVFIIYCIYLILLLYCNFSLQPIIKVFQHILINLISNKNVTNAHSFMKHGFFSLKQFLSHITKFPRGFWSRGIFPFTGFIERDFSIHQDFFFPLVGFFIHFDLNLWSLFKIRRFLKKLLEDFSLLVKKTIKYSC